MGRETRILSLVILDRELWDRCRQRFSGENISDRRNARSKKLGCYSSNSGTP
ncbi:hypothetical protein AVDCRST_MAG84-4317 [uncultured Microcoleus sp.]|uniref:Uncharacterized protein n=1 Tax=uncultured Microcoleus sp. TaxID=259945 RepID=A0A6J4MZH8_9CYAN|nr:hypothetical protein AVDCRST_MAG84-4317 [uncultured Microcoleus sp.]